MSNTRSEAPYRTASVGRSAPTHPPHTRPGSRPTPLPGGPHLHLARDGQSVRHRIHRRFFTGLDTRNDNRHRYSVIYLQCVDQDLHPNR
jgi:hypothetical protein